MQLVYWRDKTEPIPSVFCKEGALGSDLFYLLDQWKTSTERGGRSNRPLPTYTGMGGSNGYS